MVLRVHLVMNVMGLDHALEVFTFSFGYPFDSLMDYYVMENNIKNSIGKNTQPNRCNIRIAAKADGKKDYTW